MSVWTENQNANTIEKVEKREFKWRMKCVYMEKNYQSVSQSAVFVVYVSVCVWSSFFLFLFLTFYFSSFQLDTLNDLMCDENSTHYIAVQCNNVLLFFFSASFLSLPFVVVVVVKFFIDHKRETIQTNNAYHWIADQTVCWHSSYKHVYVFILSMEWVKEWFVCFSFDSRYHEM